MEKEKLKEEFYEMLNDAYGYLDECDNLIVFNDKKDKLRNKVLFINGGLELVFIKKVPMEIREAFFEK